MRWPFLCLFDRGKNRPPLYIDRVTSFVEKQPNTWKTAFFRYRFSWLFVMCQRVLFTYLFNIQIISVCLLAWFGKMWALYNIFSSGDDIKQNRIMRHKIVFKTCCELCIDLWFLHISVLVRPTSWLVVPENVFLVLVWFVWRLECWWFVEVQ